jgi:DNA-directed RNA polymerase III subunit RPC3
MIVHDRCGYPSSEIFQDLLLAGHARTEELELLYNKPSESRDLLLRGKGCSTNGKGLNGLAKSFNEDNSSDKSSFKKAFSALSKAGFIIPVHESYLRSEEDNRYEAEMFVKSLHAYRGELKGRQLKEDYLQAIEQKLVDWKYHAIKAPDSDDQDMDVGQEGGKKRKREEDDVKTDISNKRQRTDISGSLARVKPSNGEQLSSPVQHELAFRVNYDKLSVVARNEKLVDLVSARIGKTASIVYRELLRLLDKDLQCCNTNAGKDLGDNSEDPLDTARSVLTSEISEVLEGYEDIGGGIGYAPSHLINLDFITHRKTKWRKDGTDDEAEVSGEASSDEEDEESEEEEEGDDDGHSGSKLANGSGKLKSEHSAEKDDKHLIPSSSHTDSESCLELTRQNLFLLAEHPYAFVTYLPGHAKYGKPESWTVDFRSLSKTLILLELESVILSRYTENGLRIIRILHEKGKLDEKALASLTLMNQKTMRSTLTLMHEAGHLELQEIPRDTARQASRTLFLWFFDVERCRLKVLEETYKTMARCLQRIRVEREEVRDVIEKAERTDVVGREEEFLSEGEMVALGEWRRVEEMLLGQVGRLDDTVAVLRDY